jgi:preprotein translocase subunit SecA
MAKDGLKPEDDQARYDQLLEHYKAECKAEQEEVLSVGGLYVLGTERHESRREGFDMFEAMIGHIKDDFVRYVFHLKVVQEEEPKPTPAPKLTYSAPEGPAQGAARNSSSAMVAERAR